jgi:hypothetical protein
MYTNGLFSGQSEAEIMQMLDDERVRHGFDKPKQDRPAGTENDLPEPGAVTSPGEPEDCGLSDSAIGELHWLPPRVRSGSAPKTRIWRRRTHGLRLVRVATGMSLLAMTVGSSHSMTRTDSRRSVKPRLWFIGSGSTMRTSRSSIAGRRGLSGRNQFRSGGSWFESTDATP